MNEKSPLRIDAAVAALVRSVATTSALLVRHRVRQPTRWVGHRLRFGDGTTAVVYRETVLDGVDTADPAVLVVSFRLCGVRGERAHAAFRLESLLNTPLFVGFPGFRSKLWLTHDVHHVYRGFYEWDGPDRAEAYVRALWWVLALVSDRSSIHYRVIAGLRRDDLLHDPGLLDPSTDPEGWWRLEATETGTDATEVGTFAGSSTEPCE